MLFYWFPFEDGLAVQSKWVDGGWMAPGVYYGVAPDTTASGVRISWRELWAW